MTKYIRKKNTIEIAKLDELSKKIDELEEIIRNQNACCDKLMTAKQITNEFKIGYRTVLELFAAKDFPAIEYTKPKKVLKSQFIEFLKDHPSLNK